MTCAALSNRAIGRRRGTNASNLKFVRSNADPGLSVLELTDVNAAEVAMGDKVEMTFRRLNSADGIQNYFWKAKPLRDDA